MVKLIAIGVDGGTLSIIKDLANKGELPAFKKIMQNGSYGKLRSLNPPVTCPLWKSYSTGKNYAKLGSYGWIDVDLEEKRMRVNTSKHFRKYTEIWDYAGDAGLKSGVINMSLSFPPQKIDGFFISGNAPSDEASYTYPKSLKEEITKKHNYKVSKSKLKMWIETPELVKETMEVIKSRFDVAKAKVNDVDFMQIIAYRTDAVMHFMWQSDFMRDVYKLIDKEIGELMDAAGKDCDFVIMSDHGFRTLDWIFYSNNWLRERGYLVEKKNAGDIFNRLGISRDLLFKITNALHLTKIFKKLVPKSTLKSIKSWHGEIGGADTMYIIDWDKSKIIGQSAGAFYINREGKEKQELIDQLVKELRELKNPATGEKVIGDIVFKKDIYNGEFISTAPDLIGEPRDKVEINGSLGPKGLFSNEHHWQATHALNGMFFLYGPSFKNVKEEGKASLLDIMPTVLHAMGQAIPTDVDGKVLEEYFVNKKSVAFRDPLPEKDETVTSTEKDSITPD
ncbi:MAG: hypothetical protein CL943_00505 [Candidatus Diapherotrites archaeon]|uniref:Nucleotide pyrophosphatase n=1 Tax=Candidatus Iainarchaeum sp. TaxID=3101447 RepID=A0A2D6M019_9ARCH|nr:hypothetical protein [Candidatus Diapherotrites archaeon]|tara:strand:+ start:8361 stop:9878 length:1518 start_codon:yes stop_codon:yes gene_type:complete